MYYSTSCEKDEVSNINTELEYAYSSMDLTLSTKDNLSVIAQIIKLCKHDQNVEKNRNSTQRKHSAENVSSEIISNISTTLNDKLGTNWQYNDG